MVGKLFMSYNFLLYHFFYHFGCYPLSLTTALKSIDLKVPRKVDLLIVPKYLKVSKFFPETVTYLYYNSLTLS